MFIINKVSLSLSAIKTCFFCRIMPIDSPNARFVYMVIIRASRRMRWEWKRMQKITKLKSLILHSSVRNYRFLCVIRSQYKVIVSNTKKTQRFVFACKLTVIHRISARSAVAYSKKNVCDCVYFWHFEETKLD